jgi:hypothetical protein
MEMAMWVFFCLFCSVGMVQCGAWFLDAIKSPDSTRCGCRVVPLYDDPEALESRIRLAVREHCRNRDCCEALLMVDMGLGEECKKICERLAGDSGMFYLCGETELTDVLRELGGQPREAGCTSA